MSAAAELLRETGHVDLAFTSQADANGAVVEGLGDGDGHFDGGNLEGNVDEILGVGDVGAGLLKIFLADGHNGQPAVGKQLQRVLGAGLESDALGALVLIEHLIDAVGIDAQLHQFGAQAKRLRTRVGKLKPACIGHDGDVEAGGDGAVVGNVPASDQLAYAFTGAA